MIRLHEPPATPYALTVQASLELTSAAKFIEAAVETQSLLPNIDSAIQSLVRARELIGGESNREGARK
jgi:hypothetical protein